MHIFQILTYFIILFHLLFHYQYEAHIDKSCEVLVWEVSEKFGIEGRGQQSKIICNSGFCPRNLGITIFVIYS